MSQVGTNSQSRILMVLPTLGERPDFLRQTLESIKLQDDVLFDIVMVFPLDNEVTMDLAKEFDAITVADPGGLSAAVNVGIAQAKDNHEFIGWIGDDDLLVADSISTAIALLDKDPKAVLTYGYCDYIDEHNNHLFTNRAGNIAPWLMTWGPDLVPCPGTVFRKSALAEAGEFDETLRFGMDLDMLLRLRKIGKFLNAKKPLAAFRWHATSTTVSNRSIQLKEVKRVKRRHLSKPLRIFAPFWEPLVQLATNIASHQVNKKAYKQK